MAMDRSPRYRLWTGGSNSGCQLGIGQDQDAHHLLPAQAEQAGSSGPLDGRSIDDEEPPGVGCFPPFGWRVDSLASGSNHTVAILCGTGSRGHQTDRQLWITGTGLQGQLGGRECAQHVPLSRFRRLELEDEVIRPLIDAGRLSADHATACTPKLVACGWNVTYLVLRKGETERGDLIVSLGLAKDNAFGELGVSVPTKEAAVHLVDIASATGSAEHLSVVKVAAGLRHAAVLVSTPGAQGADGKWGESDTLTLVGWGSARHGQVGPVAVPPATAPGPIRTRPRPVAAVAWEPQKMQTWRLDRAVSLLESLDLAAGRDHTVALVAGRLHFFGSNRQGQCSLPRQTPSINGTISSLACNWNGTLVLSRNADGPATVVASGNNTKGQFGTGSAIADATSLLGMDTSRVFERHGWTGGKSTIVALASGSEHTLILAQDAAGASTEVWGTGWNEHGNLAQGDETDRFSLVPLSIPSPLHRPVSIWAGCGTTFIQTLTRP